MNPLTELHERLAYSAVAGTALLEEDFRLKKAMENLAPLVQKNLVFEKIHDGLQQLFHAEETQRGKLLLNLLGLVDAVLYTQASSGIQGELIMLPDMPSCGTLQQIPYSELKPLVDALTTTASGRMEVLQEVRKKTPQYLSDARIINLLIADLGDTYKEMSALSFRILRAIGKGDAFTDPTDTCMHSAQLVKCLKNGFDPKGKMDMAKRVSLICEIAKEKENDWYISLLETAENRVREHAILALGYHRDNIPLLLELTKTERGKAKQMTYRALGQMDAPELDEFWQKNLKKNKKFAEYVTYVKADGVADIVALRLREAIEAAITRAELFFLDMEEIECWCNALTNKCSDAVFELYRWLFGTETDIHHLKKETFYSLELCRKTIEYKICQTLVLIYPQKLVDFLKDLSETHPNTMEKACFICDLLTLPADKVYEKWAQRANKMLHRYFEQISYQDGAYILAIEVPDYLTYTVRTLKEPLDPRWFASMVQNHCTDTLESLLPIGSADACKKIGQICYEAYLTMHTEQAAQVLPGQIMNCVQQTIWYLQIFKTCGVENIQGVILALCKRQPQISTLYLHQVFESYQEYAGTETTHKEAEQVLRFYQESNYKSISMIQKMRDMMLQYEFLKQEI